jgi:hypothetical protein
MKYQVDDRSCIVSRSCLPLIPWPSTSRTPRTLEEYFRSSVAVHIWYLAVHESCTGGRVWVLKREGGERDRAHRGAFVDQKGTDRTCLKYYCSIDQISSAYYYLCLDPSTTLGAYSVATVHPVHAKTLHIGQAVVTQLHPWPLIARFLLPRLYNIYYLAVPPPAEIFLSHIIASFISTFFYNHYFSDRIRILSSTNCIGSSYYSAYPLIPI